MGSRAWAALYLGMPSSPEGGLVLREWLDTWRMPAAPPRPVKTVIGVDPSDSGSGDSCGLVAASMTSDGVVAVVADVSAPLTSDAWARAAVELAMDLGASEIAVEGFSARETYVRVVTEALRRYEPQHPIKVTSWPPKGSGRGGGDSMARSAALLQGLEVGTVRLAGHLPALEEAAVAWQQGVHQPDSLAALVVAHDVLVHSAGQVCTFAAPIGVVGAGASGGYRTRLGRPDLATLMAGVAAEARQSETDTDAPAGAVTSMSGYRRRLDGGGYDPLRGVRFARPRR